MSIDAVRDEEQTSTGLGFVCHLTFLLAKYLAVPLRFSLHFAASRSVVRDDGGAEFALYRARGVDRERFDRALLLLRFDIEQVRPDPR